MDVMDVMLTIWEKRSQMRSRTKTLVRFLEFFRSPTSSSKYFFRFIYTHTITYCALCLSFLLFSHPSQSNPTKIHLAIADQTIVVTKLDEHDVFDNPIKGIVRELFKRANLEWGLTEYPAARAFHRLRSGSANFSIMVDTSALEGCCIVGKTPIVTIELRVYHRKGIEPIIDKSTLMGKDIITIEGYTYGPLKTFLDDQDSHIKTNPTPSHKSAFEMLKEGRAKYLLDYKHPAIAILHKYPIDEIQFETLQKINLYLVLHKDYPSAKETIERLDSIARDMDLKKILSLPEIPG